MSLCKILPSLGLVSLLTSSRALIISGLPDEPESEVSTIAACSFNYFCHSSKRYFKYSLKKKQTDIVPLMPLLKYKNMVMTEI